MQNDTAIDTTVQPRRFGLRRIRRLARFLSQRTIPAQPKGFTLDPTSRLEPPAGASTYFVSGRTGRCTTMFPVKPRQNHGVRLEVALPSEASSSTGGALHRRMDQGRALLS
jgi:hypothetical protein